MNHYQPRKVLIRENNQLAVKIQEVMTKRFIWVSKDADIESAIRENR